MPRPLSADTHRSLRRLIAVHGRYSYMRMAQLVYYSFYKNLAFIFVQFWFGFFSAWAAQVTRPAWVHRLRRGLHVLTLAARCWLCAGRVQRGRHDRLQPGHHRPAALLFGHL